MTNEARAVYRTLFRGLQDRASGKGVWWLRKTALVEVARGRVTERGGVLTWEFAGRGPNQEWLGPDAAATQERTSRASEERRERCNASDAKKWIGCCLTTNLDATIPPPVCTALAQLSIPSPLFLSGLFGHLTRSSTQVL
ncbi:hypothetical protein PHBOTO_001183 [Pseudozyma hubeiensis]|nr:hypothetical protein PHBOTO_001183 [Pseudozyma hubeiensis]